MNLILKKISIISSLIICLFLTGCKEEWEQKVMTNDWYKEHPTETDKLYADCKAKGEQIPVCIAVNQFKYRESQLNATGLDFSDVEF